ncbi:NAD(P)-dependent oxidoreductase [Canibacter oris]|uniref:NAD(P)-binding domain-containing protein n=1 Tax=Canibacter oris TaxID=1365628 RepID=A0A840DFC0_9MICO|nr:NAD(P)H-binding protein [Canibacter oris]MBB4071390.1 hypothetical protein [Canibacter oris]
MKIAVLGAAGMIGKEIVAEAKHRGHEVSVYTRSGGDGAAALNLSETKSVSAVISDADATVISVAGRDNYTALLDAHRTLIAAAPNGRVLIVGGAGSLLLDGVRLVDTPQFPEMYREEALTLAQMLEDYRASQGIDWTIITPAPLIAPGTRTADYRTALDSPAGDFVSTQDFAVAVVDEIELPRHQRERFTVASKDAAARD